jgi:hypothetical protein
MRYKRDHLNLALILGVIAGLLTASSGYGQTHQREHPASDAALKVFLKQYLKDQDVEDDGTARYIPAFVDLNDDGTDEVIVHVIGQSLCGTGGCLTLVLVPVQSSFRIVSRIGITRPPIRVLNKQTNGWHDLAVWVQGGGIQPGYEVDLPFDGESYATNPTVAPAHRVGPKATGRVVVSDEAKGIPLG